MEVAIGGQELRELLLDFFIIEQVYFDGEITTVAVVVLCGNARACGAAVALENVRSQYNITR